MSNPLLYGPVRLSECLAHPEGWYGEVFSSILVICDPGFERNLTTLRNREPGLEIIPELGLGLNPGSADPLAMKKWLGDLESAFAAFKAVGVREVALNTENESAPNQNLVWRGHPEQARQYGKQYAGAVRAYGFRVALEGILDYEDPQLDPRKGTGSPHNGFVPFCQGTRADVCYYSDQGALSHEPAKASRQVVKLLGVQAAVPEVWLLPRHLNSEADWDAFFARVRAARALGPVAVVPQDCGDVLSVLSLEQVERVRDVLKS